MNSEVQIIAICSSVAVILFVFQLVRRRKLREEYAMSWLFASLMLVVVSVWRGSLDWAARLLGVAYPPSVLLLAVILIGFLVALHYSISLSRLSEQSKKLAQEIALLRHRVEEERMNSVRGENP